jgi:hypothetical protein
MRMLEAIWWFFTPDTVFSTERLAKGEWAVIPSLVKNAFKRAIFIMPGIYLAGVRDKQMVVASILGSVGVSASLLVYFIANPDYSTDLCKDTN